MISFDFQAIFRPRSIAVIGASSDPVKFGGRAYLAVRERCDHEKLYAVNPNVAQIDGVRTYANIRDIGDDIDLAIVTVPAPFVVQSVKDCADKKVRIVEILTAGFSETASSEGILWEKQIGEIAGTNGMRIIGPNCFGVYSPESAITILPGPDYPKETGSLGFLGQSGGFTGLLVRKAMELGIRISKAVSYGNACDLNETDFISYFHHDEQTRIIAAYIEGTKEGRRFFEIVKETAPKKPLIIWKGGLTHLGSRAVVSHTASLAGSRQIWEGFFHQTGAIAAIDRNEMLDLIIGFHCTPDFRGKNVSVVGGGGAITVAASDALERAGLSIIPFTDETQQAIRAHLPPHGNSVKNPVDMGSPLFEPKTLRPILEATAKSETVDAVIVEQMVFKFRNEYDQDLANVIPSVRSESGKPFIVTLPQTSTGSDVVKVEETRRRYRQWYLSRSIPVFDSTEQASNVLSKIMRYNEFTLTSRCG